VVKNKCVQIIKARKRKDNELAMELPKAGVPIEEAWNSSIIGDFNNEEHPNETVFGRTVTTYWKPVLLVDPASVRIFPYLLVTR